MQFFRCLTIGFLTILALGVGADSAFAGGGFAAEQLPATLKGTQEGKAVFEGDGLKVSCNGSTFSGQIPQGTEAAETASASPSYTSCTALGQAATVTTTGCSYVLGAGTETATDEFSGGKVDVSCSAGKSITIAGANCEATIGTQSGLSGVSYTNHTAASPKNFSLKISLSGEKYTKTKDGVGCPFSGTGVKEDGSLAQSSAISGFNGAGVAEGVLVIEATKLCKANEAKCSAGNTYAAKTVIEASSTDNRFKVDGPIVAEPEKTFTLEVQCGESSMIGTTADSVGHPTLQTSISTLSFQKCTTGGNACTVSAEELPYQAWFLASPFGTGMGIMVSKIHLSCATPSFNCIYGRTDIGMAFPATGGEPATLAKGTKTASLSLRGFGEEKNCPLALEWSGKFTVTEPKKLWITY